MVSYVYSHTLHTSTGADRWHERGRVNKASVDVILGWQNISCILLSYVHSHTLHTCTGAGRSYKRRRVNNIPVDEVLPLYQPHEYLHDVLDRDFRHVCRIHLNGGAAHQHIWSRHARTMRVVALKLARFCNWHVFCTRRGVSCVAVRTDDWICRRMVCVHMYVYT